MAKIKEVNQILREAESHGLRLRHTRRGVTVMGSGGQTAHTHWTPSDGRALRNFRADIRRLVRNNKEEVSV